MKTSLHILLIITVCLFTVFTKSQTTSDILAFSSSGGNALGSGGSASISVGQVAYTTANGTNGSVEQGAQHHYDNNDGPIDLPIELISFTGQCNGNIIELKWVTATEINNDYYTVERSMNNMSWETIGQVDGAGNSNTFRNYFFSDPEHNNGIFYYRFKQTDFDGNFNYSNIINVESCKEDLTEIKVYPNPVTDYLKIIVQDNSSFSFSNVSFSLYDINQKLLENKIIEGSETTVSLECFAPGTYFLKVIQDNKEVEGFQIIKN
jgi:hypothetical protein